MRPAYEDYRASNEAPHAFFYDDFNGNDLKNAWAITIAGTSTVQPIQSATGGMVRCELAATSGTETAALHWGDSLSLDPARHLIFEARVKMDDMGVTSAYFGLTSSYSAGNHNNVDNGAYFLSLAGDAYHLRLESDDGTNDNDDVLTQHTVVADVWSVYRIDFTQRHDVKFFVDGKRLGESTQFDMSESTLLLQPMFVATKSTGTDQAELEIDYVKAWQEHAA